MDHLLLLPELRQNVVAKAGKTTNSLLINNVGARNTNRNRLPDPG